MPKARRPNRHARPQDQLQSPFFQLPAELRIKIYRYSLIKDTPINLWPHKWIENEDVIEDGTANLDRLFSDTPSSSPSSDDPPSPELKIRHQTDLVYVRTQLSTGLLGTCRQAFNEASHFFWTQNHFHFSGRSGWQGLLRFLLTIGPSARSRIHRLSVHAPIYMRWPDKGSDPRDLNGRSKNFPKMHMSKIPEEGHLDREAVQRVCGILAQDRTLRELEFVIPDSFRNGDEDDYGGYEEDHDWDGEEARARLLRLRELDWVKITVVVEKGGYLAVDEGPKEIMSKDWDLRCEPGSHIWEKGDVGDKAGDYAKHEVQETRTWTAPCRALDYLTGVRELFKEAEKESVHANSGRHAFPASKASPRALTAFGGCRFIEADGEVVPLPEAFW